MRSIQYISFKLPARNFLNLQKPPLIHLKRNFAFDSKEQKSHDKKNDNKESNNSHETRKISDLLKGIAKQMGNVGNGLHEASKNFKEAGDNFIRNIQSPIDESAESFIALGETLDIIIENIKKIFEDIEKVQEKVDNYGDEIVHINEELIALYKKINENLKPEIEKLKKDIESIDIKKIKDDIKNLTEHTKTLENSLKTILENIENKRLEMIRKIAQIEIQVSQIEIQVWNILKWLFIAGVVIGTFTYNKDLLSEHGKKLLGDFIGDIAKHIAIKDEIRAQVEKFHKISERINHFIKETSDIKKQMQVFRENITALERKADERISHAKYETYPYQEVLLNQITHEMMRLQIKYNQSLSGNYWLCLISFSKGYSHQKKLEALQMLKKEMTNLFALKKTSNIKQNISLKTLEEIKAAYESKESEDEEFKIGFLNNKLNLGL